VSDIDDQVAAFAAELDGTMVFDLQQIQKDTTTLAHAMIAATTHEAAAVELREFLDAHPEARDYARAVAVGALGMLGQYVVLFHDFSEFDGTDGALARLKRIAYAARGVGLPVFAAQTLGGI